MIPILVLFILLLVMIIMQKFNITCFFVTFVSLSGIILGHLLTEDNYIWKYNLIAGIILFISYYILKNFNIKYGNIELFNSCKKYNSDKPDINKGLFYIVTFFVFYNYIVGGIPILNANVEVARFNFTNSGLFGIPGRMCQYGIYFLVFYVAYYYFFENKYKEYFIYSIVLFVICKIFSGFKGSVYDIVVLTIYLMSFYKNNINFKKFFNLKFIILVLCAFAFIIFMFYQYKSSAKYENVFDYLLKRMTVMQVEAGHYLLKNVPRENYLYEDFVYYIRKYTKINLDSSVENFSLENRVSAALTGVELSSKNFIVSVTIGGFNELSFNLGNLVAFIIIGIIGGSYGYLEKTIKSGKLTAFKFASYGLLIFVINSFISKGGSMYYIINYVLMIILMRIFYILGNFRKGIVKWEKK